MMRWPLAGASAVRDHDALQAMGDMYAQAQYTEDDFDHGLRSSIATPRQSAQFELDLEDATPSKIATLYEAEHMQRDEHRPFADEEAAVTVKDLLEEARAEGLCHDTFLDDPFELAYLPTPPASAADDLDDWPGLDTSHKAAVVSLVNGGEKWAVDKDSAAFLASVLALGRDDADLVTHDNAHLTFNDLKIEEPIMQCDPDLEIQKLRSRNVVKFSTSGLLPFPLDAEKGESAEWSRADLRLPTMKDAEAATEKLEVDQVAMKILREIALPPRLSDGEAVRECMVIDSPQRLAPQTPPLLPMSPPVSPEAPPVDLMEMCLTSTPGNIAAIEAADLERRIMQADDLAIATPERPSSETGAPVSGAFNLCSSLPVSSSPAKRRVRQKMDLEVPLLPDSTLTSSPDVMEATRIPDEIHALVPWPETNATTMTSDAGSQDLDAFFDDVLAPFAESALAQAENEGLVEVDTTMRIAVPHVEGASPVPPWKQYSQTGGTTSELESQRSLLQFTKHEILQDESSWSGVSRLERTLGWSPFPAKLGKIRLDDSFDDDGSAARYMSTLAFDDDVDLDGLISKADGLRILDGHESDDDEMDPADFEDGVGDQGLADGVGERTSKSAISPHRAQDMERAEVALLPAPLRPARIDMQTLLRKRKLELEAASVRKIVSFEHTAPAPLTERSAKRPCLPDAVKGLVRDELLKDNGIACFLQLQGKPLGLLQRQHEIFTALPQPMAPPAIMTSLPGPATRLEMSPLPPAPKLVNPERAMQVIASTKLLSDRALVRELTSLLPALDLVERAPTRMTKQSAKETMGHSDHVEADLTISPSTGLILTSLQKLKQRPLPGQDSFFGVRERVVAASLRYERLVVLVAQAQQLAECHGSPVLGEHDCEALAGFMAFTAAHDADTDVYVVQPSEQAKWIADLICQHNVALEDGMDLLQEESLWERLLRTAGLNAFAAQVILSSLKTPTKISSNGSSSVATASASDVSGLAAFVGLSTAQRVQWFGPVLGGVRVLRRVSDVLDGRWGPAFAVRR
ncbi:hypothetical protein LTR53_004728 [Teratosphaeriaceae sp. CCFEE 6253]|nr:hypothetical protein LTR53_004728 [Teratosphaeriaceae sp. CCFEE 6253]